jgi:anti-sigma B factor antagonist
VNVQCIPSQSDDAVTLAIDGEVDVEEAPLLTRAIIECARIERVQMVVLDLSAVTFFGSSAIRALIRAGNDLRDRGVTLHVDRTNHLVAKVLELTGVAALFPTSGR